MSKTAESEKKLNIENVWVYSLQLPMWVVVGDNLGLVMSNVYLPRYKLRILQEIRWYIQFLIPCSS